MCVGDDADRIAPGTAALMVLGAIIDAEHRGSAGGHRAPHVPYRQVAVLPSSLDAIDKAPVAAEAVRAVGRGR
jgi:hypothetical protein